MNNENKERWDKIVSAIKNERRRGQFDNLVRYLSEHSSYFTAPASPSYHCSWEEGLLEHSLNVAYNALKFNRALGYPCNNEELIIAGLFHDLGKCMIEEDEPYYNIKLATPNQVKAGYVAFPPYEYNKAPQVFMTVPQRAVRVVTQFIDISDACYQAILVHDGQYVQENKPYGAKENPMALILHYADSWAGFVMEGRVDKTENGKGYKKVMDDKIGKHGYLVRKNMIDSDGDSWGDY